MLYVLLVSVGDVTELSQYSASPGLGCEGCCSKLPVRRQGDTTGTNPAAAPPALREAAHALAQSMQAGDRQLVVHGVADRRLDRIGERDGRAVCAMQREQPRVTR